MATEFIVLKGKGSWINHNRPDKFDKWGLMLHPDAEALEIIRDLQAAGLKNQLKKDEDGYYCRFSRPIHKMIKGKLTPFTPPKIFLADGSPAPEDISIGNGSDVAVKLAVYEHGTPSGGKAKAARWESLRIDNLIPYERERDQSPEDAVGYRGMEEVPKTAIPF